ncbi:MAG TPA: hypothetical protein VLI39_14470 [Sedimentisphaerales bacterium]|nr:hypothetical protein [Sedimentisphaerales bacterium]
MTLFKRLPELWQYVLLGVVLWIVVDWGTAGGFRIAYFQKYGPTLLLFYVGYPLVFSILAFRLRWSERRLFGATLVAILLIEVLFVGNPLLTTFPALLAGIQLAVAIYATLTYFPLWFVRGELGRHRRLIAVLILVELIIMTLTTIGNPGP